MMTRTAQSIDPAARFVLISLNPKAGRGSSGGLAKKLAAILDDRGFQAVIETDIDQIQFIAAEKQASGDLRTVISVGGDGTLSLLLNTLNKETNICIFPQGTENVLAKYLGIKADPQFVADLIEHGQVIPMDAGQVTNDAGEKFLFALMVGCGFDGDVAERLANRRKGHITKFSYFIPVLTAIWKYRYPKMYVQDLADEQNSFDARFLFVMNIRQYALKLMIAPKADPTDGRLDACGFVKPGLLHGLKYFWQLWWSTHPRSKDYVTLQAKSFRIHADTQDRVVVQIDGDPCTSLPITVTTILGRMRLLVPQTFLEDQEA
jgi:diacylglycerol kinase family enzyme